MSEWTSLSCKESTKERFSELKGDKSQDEFLMLLMDCYQGDESVGQSPADVTATVDVDTSEAMQKLDDMEERMKDMDVVSNNQRVLTRIDDLETELKTHFERELRK